MLSGCLKGTDVAPACTSGCNSKEEDGAVMGGSGSSHLAAVSQDGWTRFLW